MATARLTPSFVRAAQPGPRTRIFYDSTLPGFGLRITPTGHKSWVVEYRPFGGGRKVSTKRITLGSVSKFTLSQAKREAAGLLAAARLGSDPAGERAKTRAAPTVAQFSVEFLERVAEKRKAGTHQGYEILLRLHILPRIGPIKLNALTQYDVEEMHRAIGRKHPVVANRCLEVISTMYTKAKRFVPDNYNPARGVEDFQERKRERFLSTEELRALSRTLIEAETTGLPWKNEGDNRVVYDTFVVNAVRLLIFTGCRLDEILSLKWEWVDLERGLLLLPDSKTGRKTVYLNAPARTILAGLEPRRIGDFVFPGRDPRAHRWDLKKPWARICAHAGLERVRIHDLRHTFASVGVGSGLGLPVVGKLLGHHSTQTTARYGHLDVDPVREANDRIGSAIAAAMQPRPLIRLLHSTEPDSGPQRARRR